MIDFNALKQGAFDRARHFKELCRFIRNGRFEPTADGRIYLPDMCAYDGGFFRSTVRAPDNSLILAGQPFHNLLTTQGRNYVWDVSVDDGTKISTWYLAPFSGNVTPDSTWTAANFTSTATEFTNYTESTRVLYVPAAAAAGATNNTASLARFTAGTGGGTIYGFAMISASAKSATTGSLIAAARDANAPITLAEGYKVDVEYALALTSS